jgi:hypothetical protein
VITAATEPNSCSTEMVARAKVEPPPGWAPGRLMIGALQRLGYEVTELRMFGAAGPVSILVIS